MLLLAVTVLCIPQVVAHTCRIYPWLRRDLCKSTVHTKVTAQSLLCIHLTILPILSISSGSNCCNQKVHTSTAAQLVTVTTTSLRVETVTSQVAYSCTAVLNDINADDTPRPSGGHINTTTILLLTVLSVVVLLLLMCGVAWIICFQKNRRNAKSRKATAGSSYSLGSVQLSASYSSYEIMRPSIHSTKQPTQLHSQAEPGRQTLHHYQSLKEMSPDSDYTQPITRPYQSR